MKVGSLFSGIGGFDIGFERAGMEVAWQCEIDPHARAVLAKHWPGVPCYDDVRGISAKAQVSQSTLTELGVIEGSAQNVAAVAENAAQPLGGVAVIQNWPTASESPLADSAQSALGIPDPLVGVRRDSVASLQIPTSLDFGSVVPLVDMFDVETRFALGVSSESAPLSGVEFSEGLVDAADGANFRDAHPERVRHLKPVDIIAFGSPCQDLSVAGKRGGLGGERSGLFFEATRIIAEMREASNGRFPTLAIWENVPGVFSSNGGADFGAVLDALAGTGAVDIAWRVIDAQHWVPQRRRRVFVVAVYPPAAIGRTGIGCAAEILSLPAGLCGDPPPRRTAGQGVAADVAPSPTGSGRGTARAGEPRGQDPIVLTRRGRDGGSADEIEQSGVTPALRTYGGGSSIPAVANPLTATYAKTADNTQGAYPPTLVVDLQGIWSKANRSTEGPVAPTMSPQLGGVRRLTPTECERLQGFPDGWTAGQSDSHRYRQLGNAVPVLVAEWIGRRIMAVQP